MKNIIKQIEKIKGVVTVEKAGENMAVVVFEPMSKSQEWDGREYVECTTKDQFEFIKTQTGYDDPNQFDSWQKYPCVCVNGADSFSSGAFPERLFRVIDFGKYVSNRNLQGEWRAFNKSKSLSPDELVDGKIYTFVDSLGANTFRFKSIREITSDSTLVYHYSIITYDRDYFINGWCGCILPDRTLRHAIPSEAQSLIRAEIANNFFFELK